MLYFSKALLTVPGNLTTVSEEHVLSSMDTTLSQMFAKFMDITEPSVSLEELTGLIVHIRDIIENINSILKC